MKSDFEMGKRKEGNAEQLLLSSERRSLQVNFIEIKSI